MQYKKTTLANGLRVIHVPLVGNPSVTTMVLVETGSNYEKKIENGLSHFLEHMVFKGTKNRPTSLDISKELDGLGAQSNAFTGNELTGYWAKADKKHFKKILNVVSDIYLNPSLPKEELEKERGVILQEIAMNEDYPQRKVWDVLLDLLYGDTSAGRPILGPKENIKSFKREDFESYRKKHYVAGKTVVVVAGDLKSSDVLSEVKKLFKDIPKGKRVGKDKVVDKQDKPALSVEYKKTDQTHLILGFRAFGAKNKRRPTLSLLSGLLGKGMSSRLFQKMREELGICYYVRSSSDIYTDHGYLAISAGVDKGRVEEAVSALLEECKKLKEELVSDAELKKTKDFLLGNMHMSLETSESVAEFFVEQEIIDGKIKKPKEIEAELKKVTAKDIQKLAQEIFAPERMNLALVGDYQDSSRLKKLLVI